MKITHLVIHTAPSSGDGEDAEPDVIVFDGTKWVIQGSLYPREVRFLSNLQALIEEYNNKR